MTSETDATDGAPRRVLVVDDNADQVRACIEVMRALGHEVQGASSGWDALAVAEEFEPDVVLLDIGLPDMSGYDIARELRRTNHGKRALLIAITGWNRPDDVWLSFRAGFDLHLVKPTGLRDLRAVVGDARSAGR